MLNKHEVFTTEESNRLLLPSGRVTVNRDNWALRIHDGEVVGGYEIPTTRAYEPPLGPGPELLIAGSMDAGFFGETTGEELITYDALAAQIGLSAGISQYNEESLWLKFALEGEILYVAKKPCRHSVSWDDMSNLNLIYPNVTNITVGETNLSVSLLTGGDNDPAINPGGEWNALMYPIHVNDPSDDGWDIDYTDSDLNVGVGHGRYCSVQEVAGANTNFRVRRGGAGITFFNIGESNKSDAGQGWRPCLRLVV